MNEAKGATAPTTPDALVFAVAGVAIVLWGGSPIATKLAVNEIDPVVAGVLRTVLGALVTGPAALLIKAAWPATRSQAVLLAVLALGGFVVFPVIYSIGLRFTSASHAALILASLPVLTGLFAAKLERKAPPRRWWLGAAVAMTGEVLLVGFRFGLDAGGGGRLGDLLIAGACVALAMGYVAGGRLSQTLGTWPTTLWGITAGGLALLPTLPFVLDDLDWSSLSVAGAAGIAYTAFATSILGYVAWYWALSKGGIGRVATTQFALPLISLVLAVLILDESITPPIVLATAFILSGIWIVQRR